MGNIEFQIPDATVASTRYEARVSNLRLCSKETEDLPGEMAIIVSVEKANRAHRNYSDDLNGKIHRQMACGC